MAISYDDSANLMSDGNFRGRVKISCLHFAKYIQGEDPATPAHNTRFRWSQKTFIAPDQTAADCMSLVVMDPNVQDAGKDITDTDLQSAVETALSALI